MTQGTYKLLIKMNKEYLIEFIRDVEHLPNTGYLGSDDLKKEDIEKWDSFYKKYVSEES